MPELFLRIAGLPDHDLHGLDVGSRETGRRRPTCPMVQVINGLTRHGGDISNETSKEQN